MSRKARSSRARTATSLVEALVVVPAMAIVLTGVLAVYAMYAAKLEAKAQARRIAWLRVDSGACSPVPCSTSECQEATASIRGAGIDRLLSTGQRGYAVSSFLGEVRDFFLGTVTRSSATVSVRLPALTGTSVSAQTGSSTVLCNTTARSFTDGATALEQACNAGLRNTEYASAVCP